MKERKNINIPLLGFRQNIERNDETKNVTFEVDGSVDTRPGLTEVILPEDPRYRLVKLSDDWSTFAGGAPLGPGNSLFIPLIPVDEQDDWEKWTWIFTPDGPTSGPGAGTIEGYDAGGNKRVSEPGVVNLPQDTGDLTVSFTLPGATRGSAYSVSLAGSATGGVGPYKFYIPAKLDFSLKSNDFSSPTFFGVVVDGDRAGPSGKELLSEIPNGLLTADTFQSIIEKFTLPVFVYDSSSPQKWVTQTSEITVDVGEPVISGKDSFGEIDLGTLTVGVPYTHTFVVAGGKGTKRFEPMFPAPNGLTFDIVTGVLSGTPTGETPAHSATIVVNDLVLTTDATTSAAVTFDGAFLSDYANVRWTESSGPNPPVITVDTGTNNLEIPFDTVPLYGSDAGTPVLADVYSHPDWPGSYVLSDVRVFRGLVEWQKGLLPFKYGWLWKNPPASWFSNGISVPNLGIHKLYIKNGTGTSPFTYKVVDFDFGNNHEFRMVIVTDALGLSSSYWFNIFFVRYSLPSQVLPLGTVDNVNASRPLSGFTELGTGFGVQTTPAAQPPEVSGPSNNPAGTTDPPHPPMFTSSPATTATVGVAYSYTPTAGGNSTISLVSAPAWLTLAAGILSGTPAIGDIGYGTVILAAAGTNGTVSQSYSIHVSSASGGDPAFTSTPVTVATTGVPYVYSITTSGTQPPFVITAPTLPAVLILTDNGDGTATINGTFGVVGVNAVQLLVTDNIGGTDYQNFNITVS